jgi:hypothetical protein
MKTIILRNWLSVVLSFVSTFSPVHTIKEAIPQSHPVAVVAKASQNLPVKHLASRSLDTAFLMASAKQYNYVFAGQATCEGQPCSNARVQIEVTSEYGSNVREATTDANGRYSVSMPVKGEPNQTLSWEIHGLTSDFKKADLEGHQILSDDSSIQMSAPLMFVEG